MFWCSVCVNKLMYGKAFYYESEYEFRGFFFSHCSLQIIKSYEVIRFCEINLRNCNAVV